MGHTTNAKLAESAAFIQAKVSSLPEIAIVLGSGLGPLAELIESPVVIPYAAIPHFAVSTVSGHAGELICGTLKGRSVICMNGRVHYYEGYSFDSVTYPIKVFKTLGVKTLILTNAVGGINRQFAAGDLMIVKDHINMMGNNPLIGPNNDTLGPRFPDMSHTYSPRLIRVAEAAGQTLGIRLQKGVYVALTGPSYETPAEIEMLRLLGADTVGMSTVPEAIVGNHMNMEILVINCVTNAAAGVDGQTLSHDEVTTAAAMVKEDFTRLMARIVETIDQDIPEKTDSAAPPVDSATPVVEMASFIDHTILKPETTAAEIETICREAIEYGFKTVCVNSSNIALAAHLLANQSPVPIAVVGFPLGAALSSSKAFETREAIKDGAKEIDMVINLGALKAKNYQKVLTDIQTVVDSARPYPVKVIIEAGSLTEDEKIVACALAKAAGAEFVKTSTGFGEGGATPEDVALMRRIVGNDMGVKASGGIRTRNDALKMIKAGATRIGASASVAIVTEDA